jgi:glycerol-3-phosphate cytidylyltransferase
MKKTRPKKKVITYGTFDLIHHGHINILRRARELGDYLIVALSTDEFTAGKGKQTYYTYEERKKILEAIKYVDEVIPETCWEQKIDDVVRNGVAVFVIGEDWRGKFDFLKPYCEVVYLPRTEGISTTQIKNDLGELAGGKPKKAKRSAK